MTLFTADTIESATLFIADITESVTLLIAETKTESNDYIETVN